MISDVNQTCIEKIIKLVHIKTLWSFKKNHNRKCMILKKKQLKKLLITQFLLVTYRMKNQLERFRF